ncbi:MAG: lysine--tRNA ligase [bacterium]
MYWPDKLAAEIKEKYKDVIASKKPLIIRDEKTASGRVHVGSLRGVSIHGIVADVLEEEKIPYTYLFEINDFDPMDGLPVYLDEKIFTEYLGRPLCDVPSPSPETNNDPSSQYLPVAKNFAEYYAQEFTQVIKSIGFNPEIYRSSDLYKRGDYNHAIQLTLKNADKIREIYKRVSGSVKEGKWLPVNVVCEKCGKVSTTVAEDFTTGGKGEYPEIVHYICRDLDWTNGCGHKGSLSPYDGRAKLPWKLEWAAKFKIIGVHVEGGGKDHSTKGGSRDVAETISREIFNHEPPYNIPYEFFNIAGKKMSSSKGRGSFSKDIADLLPAEIVRLLMLQKEPQRVIEFDPEGDTVAILFDTYDKFATGFFAGDTTDYSRMFKLIHPKDVRVDIKERALPRFSQIAFLSQMRHLDIEKEAEHLVGRPLNDADKAELKKRLHYAQVWIDTYAPENYQFAIQEKLPEAAKNLSEIQKKALGLVLEYIKSVKTIDGQEMHTKLHEIKESTQINPKEFFEAMYVSVLGKPSGPKAGWFLSVIDRDFLIKRFEEVI